MVTNIKSIKSTYGEAKLSATRYLINLYKKKKFPASVLRLYLAYGPKQDQNRLIPITIMACLKNKIFYIQFEVAGNLVTS